MEGVYHKKTHHVIQDAQGSKYRYCIFHVEYKNGCQRRYDVEGKEIEANFGQKALVNTGYLNSSYKTVAKVTPDTLTFDEVVMKITSKVSELERAGHAHSLCLWGDEETYNHVECHYGQMIRLKTLGDSSFIDSFTKLDSDQKAHSSNYTGGVKTGQSWTDKVMDVKQQDDTGTTQVTTGDSEVLDEEWDD
jgi:hypothetical protein